MITKSWLYDAIIYIYALSLLFYFADFASPNREAKRIGTGLLSFVWGLQTVYLVYNLMSHKSLFAFSVFETLFMLSWVLVTASLIINRIFRIELFVFLVNLIGFSVLALNFFSNPGVSPTLGSWKINDELLFIHISLAICSYAAFAVAAVFSGMHLYLHRRLKGKKWTSSVKRLPSLEKTDRYAYVSVIVGAPLLMLGLALGVVWIVLEGDYRLLFDPKVINSWVVLAAYLFYLFQRLALQTPGNKLAKWNLAAFVIVLINFAVSNVSQFHRWG
ncbi:cytochrome C assembly family protein [Paenibacillus thalictri]|uniref:Cytochrome C assembly protein n=1 Tax=Paenibacillus thalictri TaxID=2527873 RepID=A0A4Q9DYW8_9BACL|nr:cytochrome c biogenesis protein CcsA [Paenibacillus thalictri]TBL81655.1 cytochrome C assembly protein [Paenibacillus thalictri]